MEIIIRILVALAIIVFCTGLVIDILCGMYIGEKNESRK